MYAEILQEARNRLRHSIIFTSRVSRVTSIDIKGRATPYLRWA
jgi:hypothetical protein